MTFASEATNICESILPKIQPTTTLNNNTNNALSGVSMPKEPEYTIMKALYSLFDMGIQYLGYVALAIIGGFVNYVGRLRDGTLKKGNIITLMIDLFTSGFAGLLAALLANYFNLASELIFFLAGISGHLGARTIFLMQAALVKKLDFLLKESKRK